MRGRLLKIEPISKKFHDIFRFTRRTAEVTLKGGLRYKFLRHVLETGPAVSVLPYFYDKIKQQWYVVLVRQYRPAVDAVCLEAPGGLIKKEKNLRSEMARELFEEAGIKVKPSSIRLAGRQHLANSFCDQVLHLGLVDLKIKSLKNWSYGRSRYNGLVSEREFTELVLMPLSRAINNPNLITYTLAKYQIHDLARRLKYFSKNSKNKKPRYVAHLS